MTSLMWKHLFLIPSETYMCHKRPVGPGWSWEKKNDCDSLSRNKNHSPEHQHWCEENLTTGSFYCKHRQGFSVPLLNKCYLAHYEQIKQNKSENIYTTLETSYDRMRNISNGWSMLSRVSMTANVSVPLIRDLASPQHYRIQIQCLSLVLLSHCTSTQQ